MSEDSASAPSHCLRCIGPCTCATPLLHVVRRYALHHSRAGLADNLGSLGSLESPSLAAPGTPGLLDEPGSQPEPVEQGLVDASGPALDLSDLFIGDESCGEGLSDFEGFGSLREGSPVPREHSVLGVGTGFSPSEEDGHAAVPEFEFSGSPNFVKVLGSSCYLCFPPRTGSLAYSLCTSSVRYSISISSLWVFPVCDFLVSH